MKKGKRAENLDKVMRLRRAAFLQREIADMTGLSRPYVGDLCSDPSGEKSKARRRTRYAGTCLDCGGPTDGSNGRARAPKRCARCSTQNAKNNAVWGRESIIEAFKWFEHEYGYAPRAAELGAGMNTREKHPMLPWYTSVTSVFGKLSNAHSAAGMVPRKVGDKVPHYRYPDKWQAQ